MADWARIKSEYITSEISQRAIAKKYNVNPTTIARKCKAENWTAERKAFAIKTQAKSTQKSSEKISDAESDIAALKAESRRLLWEVTRDRIKAITDDTEAADVRRYVQNYADLLNSEPPEADIAPGEAEQIDAARQSFREFIAEVSNGAG